MVVTFSRADVVEALTQEAGLARLQAASVLEQMLGILSDTLVRGDSIKISSFGSFQVRHKSKRVGRNPKTKEEVMISARKTLTFKPSQCLKMSIELHHHLHQAVA